MLQHKICYPLSALSAWTTNVVPKIGHCVDLCYTVCLTSSGRKYEIIKCKDWLCVCVSVYVACVSVCVCVWLGAQDLHLLGKEFSVLFLVRHNICCPG